MAGTEESGFTASSEEMFDGATWVLCPEGSASGHVLALMQLVLAMKAKVSLLDIESHDKGVAAISHLPYVLAATLVNVLPDADAGALAMRLAAGSFRDVSRVAGSEPWLSASMLNFNSVQVRQKIAEAMSTMSDLHAALDRGDNDAVLAFFKRAHLSRAVYSMVKSVAVTDNVAVPSDGAVAALVNACRAGALVSAVTVVGDQWNVTLER
jgi:prephenate dehydrogenase